METPKKINENQTSFRELNRKYNELLDFVQQFKVIPGPNVRTLATERGTMISINDTSTSTSKGITFKGEFVTGSIYNQNEMVVIYSGVNAGTYICVQTTTQAPVTQSAPQHGTYWVSLAMGSTVGGWI